MFPIQGRRMVIVQPGDCYGSLPKKAETLFSSVAQVISLIYLRIILSS